MLQGLWADIAVLPRIPTGKKNSVFAAFLIQFLCTFSYRLSTAAILDTVFHSILEYVSKFYTHECTYSRELSFTMPNTRMNDHDEYSHWRQCETALTLSVCTSHSAC